MDLPIVKLLFLVANTIAAHICVRPPQPPPDPSERARYREREETADCLSAIAWIVTPCFMLTNAALNMCEIYIILSTVYPSVQTRVLQRILLPSSAKPLTVADFYITPAFVLGSAFLYAGSFLRYLCYRTLGRHFTFQLSLQKEHKLITEGPYNFVRHPSYLGMAVALPGMIVAQLFSPGAWWVESGMWGTWQGQAFAMYWIVFVASVALALLARVPKEDFMLKTEFKREWAKWARSTPYAVIPYVW